MIPQDAEPCDLPQTNPGNQGFAAKILPLVNIGQMYLNDGAGQNGQGIPQYHGSMGQSPWINDQAMEVFPGDIMDVVNDHSFMVGLMRFGPLITRIYKDESGGFFSIATPVSIPPENIRRLLFFSCYISLIMVASRPGPTETIFTGTLLMFSMVCI